MRLAWSGAAGLWSAAPACLTQLAPGLLVLLQRCWACLKHLHILACLHLRTVATMFLYPRSAAEVLGVPEEDFHTAVDLGDTYPPTVFVDMLRDASEYIPFELEANQWPCCGSRLAAAARRPCSSILSCSRLVAPPPRCARMLATQHNAALLCPLSCRDDGQDCRERGGAALRQCLGGPHSGKRSGLHGCWQCLVSAAACGTLHSICSARTPVRLPDRQPSGFGSGGQQTFLELAQCRALCRPPEAGRAAVLLLHTQSFTPSGV